MSQLTLFVSRNVKYHVALPQSSITEAKVHLVRTYLDTVGRTVLTIKTRNMVDDYRDRELVVTYDYPLLASLRKPVVIFSSTLGALSLLWMVMKIDLRFSSKN